MPDSPEPKSKPIAMVEGSGPLLSLFDRAYPKALRDEEETILKARRRQAGLGADPVDPAGRLGVGLSGGGIRSATFCLGLFQAMAQRSGLLRRIDFLSTVSGGGYFGTFYGRLLTRGFVKDADHAEKILRGEEDPGVLKYLRENGRYLSPNGSGDMLLGGAVLLRNWLSIHVVLAISALALCLGLQVPRALPALAGIVKPLESMAAELPLSASIWWSPYSILPLFVFLFAAIPIGWAYWLVRPVGQSMSAGTGRESVWPSWLACVAALALGIALPYFNLDLNMPVVWHGVAAVAGATIVWRFLAFLQRVRDPAAVPDPDAGARRDSQAARDFKAEASKDKERVSWKLFVNATIRHRLSLWVTRALLLSAGLFAVALVDTLGQSLYVTLRKSGAAGLSLAGIFGALTTFAGFARRIVVMFSGGKRDRPPVPLKLVATVVALLLAGFYLVTIDAAAHAIAWTFHIPLDAPEALRPAAATAAELGAVRYPPAAFVGFLASLGLAFLFGKTFSFINNSSHNQLYSSRLCRAYLGASNEARWKRGRGVTEVLRDDDCDVATYWPPLEANAAPLHLINVTINETVDGRSQVQQQDRKGTGLAIGPCGMSAGIEHHAVIAFGKPKNTDPFGQPVKVYPEIKDDKRPPYRVFEYKGEDGNERFRGEPLPVGSWVGISGAAFSTGTGYRTSLGLSLLAGLANVRIGRWWDSGVRRGKHSHSLMATRVERFLAKIFPVQIYLLDEFFARFPGTARQYWYLSDGGHFENMGGYELIRRRLPLIVIVDAEQDADANFEGMASLILKARLDFAAEIEFLSDTQLDGITRPEIQAIRRHLGPLDKLRRGRWEDGKLGEVDRAGYSLAHAALARVTYRFPDQESWLLYIKPTLTGDESADVLNYHKAHPDFPHESTGDQFFDEAQWESYRKLGEHIGALLVAGMPVVPTPPAGPAPATNPPSPAHP